MIPFAYPLLIYFVKKMKNIMCRNGMRRNGIVGIKVLYSYLLYHACIRFQGWGLLRLLLWMLICSPQGALYFIYPS